MDFDSVSKYLFKRLAKELSRDLYYHGIHHTHDVLHVTKHLAKAENVAGDDLVLLMTAALFHDSGFLVQYEDNEHLACDFARSILPEYNYSSSQVEHICEMIMSTEVPQSPKDHLAEILCDADLSYLGTEGYYSISESLRRELAEQGRVFDRQGWIIFQLGFLEKHSYFTDTAIRLHRTQKHEYIDELKDFFNYCTKRCMNKECSEYSGLLSVCLCQNE